ncbi:MAG: lipocalin family protein [Flavobacteriales bacterium]|nr:lipocalin family protein [Flavobacteriales bacterium]
MKNLIAVLLVVMVSAGCATKSEKARNNIAKTWKVSKVFQNGSDVTTAYIETHVDYRLQFTASGSFTERYQPGSGENQLNISGTWVFSDGINKVTLTDGNQTRVYSIDALDKTVLNIKDLGSSNNREIQFVPA